MSDVMTTWNSAHVDGTVPVCIMAEDRLSPVVPLESTWQSILACDCVCRKLFDASPLPHLISPLLVRIRQEQLVRRKHITKAHDRSDSANDAVTLAGPQVQGSILSDMKRVGMHQFIIRTSVSADIRLLTAIGLSAKKTFTDGSGRWSSVESHQFCAG